MERNAETSRSSPLAGEASESAAGTSVAERARAAADPRERDVAEGSRRASPRLRSVTLPALACVALLALANTNWLVTRGRAIDSWAYVNYFRQVAGPHLPLGPGNLVWAEYYKVSRVPWIALGHLSTSLVGLETTQYVLAIASIVATVFLVAVLLRPLTPEAITFGVVLVAIFPLMHGAGGWFYQNMLSGPLLVTVMLLGLRLALSERWPGNARARVLAWFAFGFLVVTIAITNTMDTLAVLPVLGVIAVAAVRRRTSWATGLRGFASATLGGGVAFLGCAVVSVAAGGRFLFYLPLYRTFTSFASTGDDQVWWEPLSTGWWRHATYLVLPLGAGIIGLVQLTGWIRARRHARNPSPGTDAMNLGIALITVHLGVLTIWIVLYFLKYHLLNYYLHSYPLLLTGVLSLAASIHLGLTRRGLDEPVRRGRPFAWFPWLAAAVSTLALLFPIVRPASSFAARSGRSGSLFVGLAVFGVVAIAFRCVRSRGALLALLVVALGLVNATGTYGDYALFGKCEAANLENSTVLDTVELTPPRPTPVFVYTNPTEVAHLSKSCNSRLAVIAYTLSGISPFTLYGPAATGARSAAPEDLPQLPSVGSPQEILFIRSVSPRSAWERDAVRALTGNRPERVIDRSVRPVGSPTGVLEVVRLVVE